ncbi:MAG: class I SAM-dependent methyltransferase, partial [Clostridiales bacterium]|nr:class I SAM-dependent methyltransferase [Clostridiales bacterium]
CRQTHVITMDVTFFVREEDGRYRRFRETHRQRAHGVDELRAWLAEAGFENVSFTGEMRMDAPREDDMRLHCAARKPVL